MICYLIPHGYFQLRKSLDFYRYKYHDITELGIIRKVFWSLTFFFLLLRDICQACKFSQNW